jgi:hypothetical protein
MSTALEDPRHRVDTELQGGTDEGPEEHLSSVFLWWVVVMVIAVGSIVLNLAHRL